MIKQFISTAALLAALALLAPGVGAQNLARVYQVTPTSGDGAGFVAAMRDHMEWRGEHGDPWSWTTYQIVVGEDSGDFVIRSGGHAWADLDAYEDWGSENGVGPEFGSTVAPLIAGGQDAITVTDTIRRRLPENMVDMEFFPVTVYYTRPSRRADFMDAWTQFHEAVVEADAEFYYALTTNTMGGEGNAVTVVGFSEDWAGMAQGDQSAVELLNAAYGEDGAQELFDKFTGSFYASESYMLRMRRDLSVTGAGM
jgi:hypothetical protein